MCLFDNTHILDPAIHVIKIINYLHPKFIMIFFICRLVNTFHSKSDPFKCLYKLTAILTYFKFENKLSDRHQWNKQIDNSYIIALSFKGISSIIPSGRPLCGYANN